MSWSLLVLAALSCLLTLNVFRPRSAHGVFLAYGFWSFLAGWLTTELALHQIGWQAIAALVCIALGGLREWPGWLGLGLLALSWLGLLISVRHSNGASRIIEAALAESLGARAPLPALAELQE